MIGESDNLPAGGTDTALTALTLDDAANIDFDEPETETVDADEDQQSEGDEGETENGESEEIEANAGEDDAEGEEEGETAEAEPAPEPTDDVHVTVNGEKLALSDLKAGYMRQADYSRKTQEVATSRRDLEALSARVTSSVDAIAEFLVSQLPAAPDFALSQTNPDAYIRQKAIHDAATERLNAVLTKAGEVTDVANTLTAEQRKELIGSESAKLAEKFPTTATNEGRKQFFDQAASAAKELGYSDEEIQTATDHRMFALAHYARIGMRAEQAKAKAAKKVENAPPVAPQKRQQGQNAAKAARNKEAMKRLARTGSIQDAMLVDFD